MFCVLGWWRRHEWWRSWWQLKCACVWEALLSCSGWCEEHEEQGEHKTLEISVFCCWMCAGHCMPSTVMGRLYHMQYHTLQRNHDIVWHRIVSCADQPRYEPVTRIGVVSIFNHHFLLWKTMPIFKSLCTLPFSSLQNEKSDWWKGGKVVSICNKSIHWLQERKAVSHLVACQS